MSMEGFYTRAKANDGIKTPLTYPDGRPSEHWLVIRGVDSDVFRRSESRGRRKAMEIAQIKDEAERAREIEVQRLELLASLVADWSFDEPCTEAAAVKFLMEAPQLADVIDRVAGDRASFFGKGSISSTAMQKPSSGSASARKGQK